MNLVVKLPSNKSLKVIGFADSHNWQINKDLTTETSTSILEIPINDSTKLLNVLNDHNHGFGLYITINNKSYAMISNNNNNSNNNTLWTLNKLSSKPILKEFHENNKSLNNTISSTTPTSSKVTDPIKYLTESYLKILYSSNIPVDSFIKISLKKLNHNINDTKIQLFKDCLLNLLIKSIENFDSRHNNNNSLNIWLSNNLNYIDKIESYYRDKRFNKLKNNLNNEDIINYLNNFKLKDLKLQIIICFELLKLFQNDNNNNNNLIKDPIPTLITRKNHSINLIGRKNKKKRLIPTLLGTVIPTNFEFDTDFRHIDNNNNNDNNNIDKNKIESLINLYFEKLCNWDVIMGFDYKDINSSWGFISTSLIPYYEKYFKKLLNNLSIKSRGPVYILKLRAREERLKRDEIKRLKSITTKENKETIKSNTIDLSSIKLTRSQSSFSNSKQYLERKTFSMTKSTPSLSLSRSSSTLSTSEPIKKRKLYAPSNSNLFHHNQIIEATPRKENRHSMIISETPKLDIKKGELQIISSPLKNTVNQMQSQLEISETPVLDRIQIKPGFFEINSSPMNKNNSNIITSSPPNINSTKRKLNFQ